MASVLCLRAISPVFDKVARLKEKKKQAGKGFQSRSSFSNRTSRFDSKVADSCAAEALILYIIYGLVLTALM